MPTNPFVPLVDFLFDSCDSCDKFFVNFLHKEEGWEVFSNLIDRNLLILQRYSRICVLFGHCGNHGVPIAISVNIQAFLLREFAPELLIVLHRHFATVDRIVKTRIKLTGFFFWELTKILLFYFIKVRISFTLEILFEFVAWCSCHSKELPFEVLLEVFFEFGWIFLLSCVSFCWRNTRLFVRNLKPFPLLNGEWADFFEVDLDSGTIWRRQYSIFLNKGDSVVIQGL